MKMNGGVSHALVPDDDTFCGALQHAAAPRHDASAPRRRRRPKAQPPVRRGASFLLAATAAATLIGCASAGPKPWSVQSVYRANQTGGISAAQGYLALARQYEGEKRYAQALEAYRKAAAAAPDDADVMNALGMALAGGTQFAPAVVALRRAVALAPDRAPLLNNLGYALLLDGQAEQARAVLNQALALDPRHRLARLNLARLAPLAGVAAAPAGPQPAVPAVKPMAEPTPQPAPTVTPTVTPAATRDATPEATRAATPAPTPVATPSADPHITAAPATLVQAPVSAPVAQVQTAPNREPLVTSRDADVGPLLAAAPSPADPAAAPADAAVAAAPATAIESPPQVALPVAQQVAKQVDPLPPPAVRAPPARVEVSNGNGVTGMAAWMRGWLRGHGLAQEVRLTNMPSFDNPTTLVEYREGFAAEARAIAAGLPRPAVVGPSPVDLPRGDVRVLLGHDIRTATVCGSACPAYEEPTVRVAAAPTSPR